MKPTISRYFVQVHSTKGTRGTGIIYYPNSPTDSVYIFTAYHCIKDTPKSEIRLEKITHKSEEFASYQLKDDETHQILFDKDASDIALLILPKSALFEITGELVPFPLLNHHFDFSSTLSIGYPQLNRNQFMQLAGEFAFDSEDSSALFSVKTHPHENLETLTTESIAAAQGMSGGGLFFNSNDKFYLFGILSKFKKTYKQFECIRLDQINKLLYDASYPLIPFTYAANIGLNEEWFNQHITKTREDLGDRYTKELPSFDLPIGEVFSGIRNGDLFKSKVKAQYHSFIKGVNDDVNRIDIPVLKPIQEEISNCQTLFYKQFNSTNWEVGNITKESIPIEDLRQLRDHFKGAFNLLYDERRKESARRATEKGSKHKYHNSPYNDERYSLSKLSDVVEEFLIFLESPFFQLALDDRTGKSALLITGKAGNGKSHLLGDVAVKDLEIGLPTILILGNQIISETLPWNQIFNILGLTTNKDLFLKTLNEIGRHKGERILFMVDALNEGIGKKNYWENYLAGFIKDFEPYPFIGLVFSIRSTYYNLVIPDALKQSESLIKFEHEGFAGVELEAVKHFATYFELNQPKIPLLSPEFSNPQFLLLLCRSLKATGVKEFPEGLSGITSVYKNYTKLISQTLLRSGNYDLPDKFNLVQDALEYFLKEFQKTGKRICTYELGIDIFSKYPRSQNGLRLFRDLIRENIFSEERGYDVIDGKYQEVDIVRFTFERYGDHIAVNSILENCDKPRELFKKGGYYYELHKTNNYLDSGTLQALAIQLPERYEIEIFEVIEDDFTDEDYQLEHLKEEISDAFVESLLWRNKESIDFEKCANYVNGTVLRSRNDSLFWTTILTLAPIERHPFNSDSLFSVLNNVKMPIRDSWWIGITHSEFSFNKSPLSRLIDWILDFEDYQNLSKESIRLTSQTLTWCLSSPNRALRDAATIALVKLLHQHLEILLVLLKVFRKIDDLYILERLYAVALGCVTRSTDKKQQKLLIGYVFKTIFRNGKPPTHLLLRDYARSIIEYGIYLNLDLKNIDITKVRPPYNSKMPVRLPPLKIEDKYRVAYDSPDYDKDMTGNAAQNSIVSSVLTWDFYTYKISSALRNVSGLSHTKETFYKSFKRNLTRSKKSDLKALDENLEYSARLNKRKQEDKDYFDVRHRILLEAIEDFIPIILVVIEKKFSKTEYQIFKRKIYPFLKEKSELAAINFKSIQPHPIARWILKRVFKLGWSKDLHGGFDENQASAYRGGEKGHYKFGGRVERIGKKYQWIAFFEILARIVDNYPLIPEWNSKKTRNYNGPWERSFSVRDIDPTLTIYKKTHEPITEKLPFPKYDSWHIDNWITELEDIPKLSTFLDFKIDDKKWIALKVNPEWKQPVEIGKERYEYSKSIDIWTRSYFIQKSKLKETVAWLANQKLRGRQLPEGTTFHYMFEREFYWSPHYIDTKKEDKKEGYSLWRRFSDSPYKGIVPYEVYESGGGGFAFQDTIGFYKPSQYLFEQMDLLYGEKTGEYVDADGNLIVKSLISSSNYKILVDKVALLKFLKKKRLALCWSVFGEKLEREGERFNKSINRLELNGAYYLTETGEIIGEISGYDPDELD